MNSSRIVSMLAFAGVAGALVMAVIVFRTPGSGPEDLAPNAVVGNAPADVRTPAPDAGPVPSAPTRRQLLQQLARFDPPDYRPPDRRVAEANFMFATAMEHYSAGDYTDAADTLQEVLRAGGSGEPLFFFGMSNLLSGEPSAGRAALQRVIEIGDPTYEEDARFYLSKALLQMSDVAAARVELERVAALKGEWENDARELLASIDRLPPE